MISSGTRKLTILKKILVNLLFIILLKCRMRSCTLKRIKLCTSKLDSLIARYLYTNLPSWLYGAISLMFFINMQGLDIFLTEQLFSRSLAVQVMISKSSFRPYLMLFSRLQYYYQGKKLLNMLPLSDRKPVLTRIFMLVFSK